MARRRTALGVWLRRLVHPRSWPVRWRLAAVSSGLTLVILVVFGGAVGQIATQRIRDDFNNEVRSAVQILASELRIRYPLFGKPQISEGPQLETFALPDDASVQVFDARGNWLGSNTKRPIAMGQLSSGISDYKGCGWPPRRSPPKTGN